MSIISASNLALVPGAEVFRRQLHEAFGGQTQSGISPSSQAPLVMIFSDPTSGEKYGYIDGWHADGNYHYSGEGQLGDQTMTRGNKALANHKSEGREVHLFLGGGKGQPVKYLGEFETLDYYQSDAPDREREMRTVCVFRLRPKGFTAPATNGKGIPFLTTTVEEVELEAHLVERMLVSGNATPTEAERREAALVREYKTYSESRGRPIKRYKIHPAGESQPIFTDCYIPAIELLVEAKGSTSRESIRMAIGQLLDYSRFLHPRPQMAILVPEKLRNDLRQLLIENNIGFIEKLGNGFFENFPQKPANLSTN